MKETLRKLLLGGFDIIYRRIGVYNISNIRKPGQKCFQVVDQSERFSKLYYDIDDAIDSFLQLHRKIK
jgi:hypothetical protein